MGWTATNTLWLATRGGDVFFADKQGQASQFDQAKLGSRGFGILDITCASARLALSGLPDQQPAWVLLGSTLAAPLAHDQACSASAGRPWGPGLTRAYSAISLQHAQLTTAV